MGRSRENTTDPARGTTLIEMVAAVTIVGISLMVTLQQVTLSHRETIQEEHKLFAYQKAMAILGELQVALDQGDLASTDELEAFADAEPSAVLTTRTADGAELEPNDPMSGNVRLENGAWKYHRVVQVDPVPAANTMRYVRVEVQRRNADGHTFVEASVGGILNVPVDGFPTVVEYDVYLLAIASAPSLWMPLPALRSLIETAAEKLTQGDPSLQFRLHWITKAGYGRDRLYVPFVNEQIAADQAAPWTYWYPGRLGPGAAASSLFSAPAFGGRVRTEAGVLNDFDLDDNGYPHAVADQWNHCMRTPAARELFEQRVVAGLEDPDEPPLQLLLADMHEQPERYRNAIFLNLHGEGLPFPPLRNVSDAAKDPVGRPGVRAVTHPARLRTSRSGLPLDDILAEVRAIGAASPASALANAMEEVAILLLDAQGDLALTPPDFPAASGRLSDASSRVGTTVSAGLLTTAEGDALSTRIEYALKLVSNDMMPAAGSAGVELRVYAYKTDPDAGDVVLGEPITVQIMGADLTGSVPSDTVLSPDGTAMTVGGPRLEVARLGGGVDIETGAELMGSAGAYTAFEAAPTTKEPHATYEMHYEMGYVASPEPYTWIRLHNTPAECSASVTGKVNGGIGPAYRLYGMEYIPSPIVAGEHFGQDLATGIGSYKNTARWRIRISKEALASALGDVDTRLTVVTRIGTDLTTGRVWPTPNQPHNRSETYAWWADSLEAVPLTERFQFQGDPRHNPYADLVAGGGRFAHGYNWFFDDLHDGSADATTDWPCLDAARLRDGFGDGVAVDVPRAMQVWRQALQASETVFTHVNGRLAGALLLGGEIALPRPAGGLAPSPVTVSGSWFGLSDPVEIDSVTPAAGAESLQRYGRTLVAQQGSGFWAKSWLGELAPDGAFGSYQSHGNLPSGAADLAFRRVERHLAPLSDLPTGTSFDNPGGASLRDLGAASLLQDGSTGKRVVHLAQPAGNLLALNAKGREILDAADYRNLPDMPGRLPFDRRGVLSEALPQAAFPDTYPDQIGARLENLSRDASDLIGASVMLITSPVDGRGACFTLISDMPETGPEHELLAKKALLFGLRGFHSAGYSELAIAPAPQVEILGPAIGDQLDNPSAVQLSWRTHFRRFDGIAPYTLNYPVDWQGSEMDLAFVVLYAREGEPFRYAATGELAVEGQRPDLSLITYDTATGDELFLVGTPATDFPAGTYILRVECFDQTRRSHVSHHQVRVEIKR